MDEISKRILIVDDSIGLLDGLKRQLRRKFDVTTCPSALEALHILQDSGPFAVILSDFKMPEMDGIDFLCRAKQVSPDSVTVMMTAWGDLDMFISALNKGGIHRFLNKPCAHELLEATLLDCLEQYRLIASEHRLVEQVQQANAELSQRNGQLERLSQQLADMNVELERLARVDVLTGLLNRRAWTEVTVMQQNVAQREKLIFGIIMLDVDHFKDYNDTFGHPAGDRCLVAIAHAIQSASRTSDACGRYGGEEFIVSCLHHAPDGVTQHAERIRRAIQELNIVHPQNDAAACVTASIGCSSSVEGAWEKLAQEADAALYAAKSAGRNCVRNWTDAQVLTQTCL